ncbi:MAG: SRPBCC family protein [Methylophilaceae bacterium]
MRKIANLVVLMSAVALTACASSGGSSVTASSLSVVEKVAINAPVNKVWEKVRNFGDLGAWHPAVAKTEIVGGTNNQKGAVRLLTLQDGGTINETLTAYNDSAKTYSYIINEGVLPVSSYASTIQVVPTSSGSEVIWQGNFKRKDVSASPAKGQGDATATKTIHAVYRGGLDNLKKISE